MSPALRRCRECEYEWSRYLRFPHCPRCGGDVASGDLQREVIRTRRIWQVTLVIGGASLLLMLIGIILQA